MTKITGTPALIGEVNAYLVKQTIKENPKITKPLLAKQTKLSLVTTSKIVDELVESGEVISIGYGKSTGGRKAMRYMVNKNHLLMLAILVKDYQFHFQIMNYIGEPLECRTVSFKKENAFETLVQSIEDCLDAHQEKNIAYLSLALPGTVSQGSIRNIPMVPAWEEFNIAQQLQEKFELPIIAENDINALTIGAYEKFSDDNIDNMLFFHLHAGIGSGIIIENKLFESKHNFAGELAYMNIADKALVESSDTVEDFLLTLFEDPLTNAKQIRQIIGRMSSNIVCVLEPDLLIIDSIHLTQKDAAGIQKEIARFIPKEYIPELLITQVDNSVYFNGLYKMTFDVTNTILSI